MLELKNNLFVAALLHERVEREKEENPDQGCWGCLCWNLRLSVKSGLVHTWDSKLRSTWNESLSCLRKISHRHRLPWGPSQSWSAAPRGTPSPFQSSSQPDRSRSGLWWLKSCHINSWYIESQNSDTSDCYNRFPPCAVLSPPWKHLAWPSTSPASEKIWGYRWKKQNQKDSQGIIEAWPPCCSQWGWGI